MFHFCSKLRSSCSAYKEESLISPTDCLTGENIKKFIWVVSPSPEKIVLLQVELEKKCEFQRQSFGQATPPFCLPAHHFLLVFVNALLEDNFPRARFSKGPVIFPVRKQILKSKPVELWQFLAHKPFNFASLTDGFLSSFLKSLKLWSWLLTRQTKNSFPGPKTYRGVRGTGPWTFVH